MKTINGAENMNQATLLSGNQAEDIKAIIRNTRRHGLISVARAVIKYKRTNVFLGAYL